MTPFEWSVVIGASVLGMFVKAVTGMGYPLFAIPLISLAIGVEDAVLIISLPNFVANAQMCWNSRAGAPETRDLPVLAGFGIAGAIVGSVALVTLPEWPLLAALIATIVVFVVQYWRSPELRIDPSTSRRWAPAVGTATGVMQGAIGVSGPVVAAWLHGYRLPRDAQVFSLTLLFGITGLAQVVALAVSGAYTRERLVAAAVVLLPVMAMIPIGERVRARLSGPGFERAVLAVLVCSAVALVGRLVGA